MFSKINTVIIKNAKSLHFSVANNDEPRFIHGDRLYFNKGRMKGVQKTKFDKNTLIYDFSNFKGIDEKQSSNLFFLDFHSVEKIVISDSNDVNFYDINERDNISDIIVSSTNNLCLNNVYKKDLNIQMKSQNRVKFNESLIHNLDVNSRFFSYIELEKSFIFNAFFQFAHFSGIKNTDVDSVIVNIKKLTFNDCCVFNANVVNEISYFGEYLDVSTFNGLPKIELCEEMDINSFYIRKFFDFSCYLKSYNNNYFLMECVKSVLNEYSEESFAAEIEHHFGAFEMPHFYKDALNLFKLNEVKTFKTLLKEYKEKSDTFIFNIENDKFHFVKSENDFKLFNQKFDEEYINFYFKIKTYLDSGCFLFSSDVVYNEFYNKFKELENNHNDIKKLKASFLKDKEKIFKENKIAEEKRIAENKDVNFLLQILNSSNPIELITAENRIQFVNALKNNIKLNGLTEKGAINHQKMVQFFDLKTKAITF